MKSDVEKLIENEKEWRREMYSEIKGLRKEMVCIKTELFKQKGIVATVGFLMGIVGTFIIDLFKIKMGGK